MARTKGLSNYEVGQRRKTLLNYIRSNMDGDGYLTLKSSVCSPVTGLDKSTINRYLKYFADEGLIEFESMRKDGYLVHYLNIDVDTKKSATEIAVSIKKPPRKCTKCGAEASNQFARFCWACGANLLSEKEALREEFHAAINKMFRLTDDTKAVSEIMKTLVKVEKLAFEEGEKEHGEA